MSDYTEHLKVQGEQLAKQVEALITLKAMSVTLSSRTTVIPCWRSR